MALLFISYRRKDTGAYVDRLAQRLGVFKLSVWYDRKGIDPGDRWGDEIRSALSDCPVVLVLIGRHWVDSRLHDPVDWVRREIDLANTMQKTVVPVFFDVPPSLEREQLPQPLHFLSDCNGYPINGDFFDRDADHFCAQLKNKIRELIPAERAAPPAPGRTGFTVLQRQVLLMMTVLALATLSFAVAQTRFTALPTGFWLLPAVMLLTTFTFFLYLLAHSQLRSPELA
jgi:hypothetical protein